ncbi:hypothetical protein [Sphingobium sp.]|uniref:hypothetical protein n=1 Tax=Sphingobium sp. TaxID=1912891 RepID=UPI000C61C468|nr:hypothetical protein [Sphingobium sp.]MBS90827.1 hypothetical protein [Sphingobium sp.]|tara:strand:- start:925 stop:1344 length:420 start_codon:yes stop_codon:yes gene_type:complete
MDATELKVQLEYLSAKPLLVLTIDTETPELRGAIFDAIKFDEQFYLEQLTPEQFAELLPRCDRLYIDDTCWDDLSADEINDQLTKFGVEYTFSFDQVDSPPLTCSYADAVQFLDDARTRNPAGFEVEIDGAKWSVTVNH